MGTKHILVVDDELYITSVLSQKLRQAGFEVRTAGDGEQGLALALESAPDLIITDFQMPRLSGFDMACRLRKSDVTAHVPVLMLTARGHRLSADELATTNIKALSAKPFSVRQLMQKVYELLEHVPATRSTL